jgi:hypothetical protein
LPEPQRLRHGCFKNEFATSVNDRKTVISDIGHYFGRVILHFLKMVFNLISEINPKLVEILHNSTLALTIYPKPN